MTASGSTIASPSQNGASPAPFLARPLARYLILVLVLWLALFLRVWQLNDLPPGLHYDEAFKGVQARALLREHQYPIFFVENFGEEPLQIYATALMFQLVGESPWAIRLVSAFFGVIFVAALYACARAFFPRSGWLAVSAAFITATLYWAINFSRLGLETNSLPMLLTLSATALARAYRQMTWQRVLGAGILTGSAVYTYLASRVWLGAVLIWFVYLLAFHRPRFRAHFSKFIVLGAIVLLTVSPLILFFLVNPLAFAGRSGTVFTPETFFTNLLRTAGMFFISGDTDPRDNLPGRPALDIILALFFVVGLALSLLRLRKPFYAFLVIWFTLMTLPSALTEFAPNFRRAIGALPAVILFCALGMQALLDFKYRASGLTSLVSSLQSPISLHRLAPVLVAVALVPSAFWSARAYFVDWASGTGLYYSFDAGLLQVARALADRPSGEQLFLTPKYDAHYTVLWALNGRRVTSFDGRRGLVLPDSSRAATYGIITHEDQVTADMLARAFSRTNPPRQIFDAQGQAYAILESFNQGALLANAQPNFSPVRVANWAFLSDAVVSPLPPHRDEMLQVHLEWRAVQAADRNYTVSVQLLGPLNTKTNSLLWAQQDNQPVGGTYPTTLWQSGETISETYTLAVPRDAPAGQYKIRVGLYDLQSGDHVPLTGRDNTRLPDDAAVILAFELN